MMHPTAPRPTRSSPTPRQLAPLILCVLLLAGIGASAQLPELVGRWQEDARSECWGVAISGSRLYVADGTNGLRILDLSRPSNPVVLGELPMPDEIATGVDLAGDVAFIATARAGLVTVDVSDPKQPRRLGALSEPFINVPAGTKRVRIRDHLAYLTLGFHGLAVIDVSAPREPVLVAVATQDGNTYCALPIGQDIVAVGHGLGVTLFRLTPERQLERLGSAEAPQTFGLAVRDSLLYLAAGPNGLFTFDISDPTSPVLVHRRNTFVVETLARDGNFIFAANRTTLFAVDATTPTRPQDFQGVPLVGRGADVVVDDRHIYTASGSGGVFIHRRTDHARRELNVRLDRPALDSAARLRVTGTAYGRVQILWSTDLRDWHELTFLPAFKGSAEATDSSPAADRRVYRAIWNL